MSQIGRTTKNLDGTRPLKGSVPRQLVHQQQMYEIQTVDQLIELIEIVAASLASASVDSGKMNTLLSNLRVYGPQLEALSKDVLDKAFVTFRNASQDERLNIMTRLNLLELIELRAKSWQISDEVNTYYKHKATNVEPAFVPSASDLTLLSTSPTELMGQSQPAILAPGELLRNSGKFTKPTKIPGKNYSKDEVVIRNADSGKVMGIKGRRVHMIEELSETIISFQRVNPGAKERLVQITGPNEEKINYAKQLIEDTIRRNASPVRLETSQGGGSCSSLASSASDETQTSLRAARNSIGAAAIAVMAANQLNNNPFLPAQGVAAPSGIASQVPAAGSKLSRGSAVPASGQLLLHSYSTNDASLGEYKFTVNVGPHSIKITGDRCDLVRAAKLVLDDYFSSSEFLASIDAGGAFDATIPSYSHQGGSVPSTPLNPFAPPVVPVAHQLGGTTSPFADSGIGLNLLAQSASGSSPGNGLSIDADDDVFTTETLHTSTESSSSNASSNNSIVTSTPSNGLTRSRRSHFSRQESTPEALTKEVTLENQVRIVHEYEDLISFAKSPLAWALPKDWTKICEKHPALVRNKVLNRFHSLNNNHINNANDDDAHIAEGARKALLARQASLNCDRFDISSSQTTRVAPVASSSVNNRLNVAHITSTTASCD